MTIGVNLTALGVRETRANLRAVIEQVGDGTPVAVMAHSQAVAVILSLIHISEPTRPY